MDGEFIGDVTGHTQILTLSPVNPKDCSRLTFQNVGRRLITLRVDNRFVINEREYTAEELNRLEAYAYEKTRGKIKEQLKQLLEAEESRG